MITTRYYDTEIIRYPSLYWFNKKESQTIHITLFDENGLRLRVDVITGEIMVREVLE